MSEKKRRKKDGHDVNKQHQAMRAGLEPPGAAADEPRRETHDEVDVVKYKSGSGGDRSRTGAT